MTASLACSLHARRKKIQADHHRCGRSLDSNLPITYDGIHVTTSGKSARIPLAVRKSRRQRARLQLRAPRCGPAAEEDCDTNNIVLMRHGAFSKHFGREA